ncbi:putative ABC transporter ATP-binding protein YheS [bacterium BMS3Bbin08]|nr:putative ABC transporter ATP-binding protein YheS [bacterium BMS3Bbin08]
MPGIRVEIRERQISKEERKKPSLYQIRISTYSMRNLPVYKMIQVNNLDKCYGRQVIFEKAGFILNSGERVGLVGRNGHGKTTLFKMILGQDHPDSGCISIPRGYKIGHLSQHISFSESTVLQEACLSLRDTEDGIYETYKAEIILMGLGFTTEDFSLDPLDLSGGYQVRLNLAKVLVSDPNLLLLDEPTNYLDIISLRWLTQFLRNWKKELIIITHDRDFMDGVTTHTMAIHRCKMRKEAGPTDKVYQQLLMEEEIHEKTRVNDDKKRKETEEFINRFRAKATRARAVQSRVKALQKKDRLEKLTEIKNLDFAFKSAAFTGKLLMEVNDISFSFDNDSPPLIDGLTFSVGKKDRIAIIGKNGKGKTTLLNLLAKELKIKTGTVRHHDQLQMAYFGQTNINRLTLHKTIEEEIMDVHPEGTRGAARKICGIMMFPGDNALKKISVLSGGEKSRVLLGKLLVSPSNMLMLDEPTNHLDMESGDSLVEAIDDFNGSVIIVTHSEMMLHALATRLIVFDNGKVILFDGTYQDFLDRVGWKSENNSGAPRVKKSRPRIKSVNKKQLRRERASLLKKKSNPMDALQRRIDEAEKEIVKLEENIEHDNREIIEASIKGAGETIKILSKKLHVSRSRLDSLFAKLDLLLMEIEGGTKEFKEKLEDSLTV